MTWLRSSNNVECFEYTSLPSLTLDELFDSMFKERMLLYSATQIEIECPQEIIEEKT
jgi:hypothetical protein